MYNMLDFVLPCPVFYCEMINWRICFQFSLQILKQISRKVWIYDDKKWRYTLNTFNLYNTRSCIYYYLSFLHSAILEDTVQTNRKIYFQFSLLWIYLKLAGLSCDLPTLMWTDRKTRHKSFGVRRYAGFSMRLMCFLCKLGVNSVTRAMISLFLFIHIFTLARQLQKELPS